jgi:glycosyltransferase involved in cell wall biosynthesis
VKKARAILVCNEETKAGIPEPFSDKVHLFPVNGISEEDLRQDRTPRREDNSFRVLTAGRLHRLKGFDLAVRAFDRFAKEIPEAVLEIVGEGPEEGRLKNLVQTLSTRDRIRFLPWLPRKALIGRMRQSDLFLFPSFRDGGGAVVVEAMASGVPVICLDTGGPGFHVQEAWGIKVAPLSPDHVISEMGKAVHRLYTDKELREEMGRAARDRAEAYYVWDRLGEEMLGIYDKVLGLNLKGVPEALSEG